MPPNRSTPEEWRLRNLAELRRVRDRIDREYAQPLDDQPAAGVPLGAASSSSVSAPAPS